MRDDQIIAQQVSEVADAIARRWLDALALPHDPAFFAAVGDLVQRLLDALPHDPNADARVIATLVGEGERRALRALIELEGLTLIAVEDEVTRHAGAADPRAIATLCRRIHEGIRALAGDLERALDERDAERLKSAHGELARFAHWTRHELNNRLGVATITATLLDEALQAGDAERAAALGLRLRELLSVLGQVTNEVLVIASERAFAEQTTVPGDLHGVFERLTQEMLPFAEHSGVELILPADPPPLQIDARRVHLLLGTLVHNAIKFADPHKSRSWVRVELTQSDEPGAWRIAVVDNGSGIAGEVREAIFEPGFTTADRLPGQGLGLAIARQAARQLGTSLWVTSVPGAGSTFSFTFQEIGQTRDV